MAARLLPELKARLDKLAAARRPEVMDMMDMDKAAEEKGSRAPTVMELQMGGARVKMYLTELLMGCSAGRFNFAALAANSTIAIPDRGAHLAASGYDSDAEATSAAENLQAVAQLFQGNACTAAMLPEVFRVLNYLAAEHLVDGTPPLLCMYVCSRLIFGRIRNYIDDSRSNLQNGHSVSA